MTSLDRAPRFRYLDIMTPKRPKRPRRTWLSWDVGIGIVLLACGMVLALTGRPAPSSQDSGSASLRRGSVLPYP